MRRRPIGYAEMMAVDPTAIQRGADGFFLTFGADIPDNERRGDVTIVHVRGSLEHHCTYGADSYEDILCRVEDALYGRDEEDPNAEPVPPSAVIMCIDSRGGVVAGLNETIAAIQKCRKKAGVPLIAYINEMAASAAYAIACSCDKIYGPASSINGSIGTISTMVSCYDKDKAEGYDVRLITSGARKADGHPHAPITKDAEAAERARVNALAESFFKIVQKSRGLSIDKIRGFQAAIFLGPDAKKVGLIDDVASLDDLVASYSKADPGTSNASAKGNETDRRAALDKAATRASVSTVPSGAVSRPTLHQLHNRSSGESSKGSQAKGEASMDLQEMITKTAAALAAATDPAKRERLERRLAAFKTTALRAEKPDDEGDEDDDEDDKSGKAAKAAEKAKKTAEAAKHKARAAEYRKKAAESDEEARKAEEDDEEDEEEKAAKAAAAAAAIAAAGVSAAADPTVVALAATVRQLTADAAALKATAVANERAGLMARATRYIPSHILKPLAGVSVATLKAIVEEAERGQPMVVTDEGDLIRPREIKLGTEEVLPKETIAMIDSAVQAYPGDKAAFRKMQVDAHLAAHADATKKALNGAAGRY